MRSLMIDKNAIRFNLNEIRARAGSAEIIANLSADGQGVGLLPMALLLREEGIGSFAVSEVKDALLLRRNGFSEESILLLRSVTNEEELQVLLEHSIICTLGSYEAAIALNGLAGARSTVAEARIRIDSGLGQYGFLPEETDKLFTLYQHMPSLNITGLYTRLSASNLLSATEQQYLAFMAVAERLAEQGFNISHTQVLDSTALFRYAPGEQRTVCVGSALIGHVPIKGNGGLRPVGQIEASLEELTWLHAGVRLGPGRGRALRKPTRVAVVDLGWFNGIAQLRASERVGLRLSERLKLLFCPRATFLPSFRVKGRAVKLLGQVGLTTLVLDVTRSDCAPGDVALLEVDPRTVQGLPVVLHE